MFYLGRVDINILKPCFVTICQCVLFWFLNMMGFIGESLFVSSYYCRYASYSFTNARLVELKTTLTNGCSNNITLPCFLQMHINTYFFWYKFLLFYRLSIVIIMTYAWHDTVRLSYCIDSFFVVADIVFRTDLIFHFDRTVYVISVACYFSVFLFSFLESIIPHNASDPLQTLCQRIMLPNKLDESFPYDDSICSRFYKWITKMKKRFNIEEEKIIFTFVVGIISILISIFCLLLIGYC